jgi:hypothetical protein
VESKKDKLESKFKKVESKKGKVESKWPKPVSKLNQGPFGWGRFNKIGGKIKNCYNIGSLFLKG